MKEEWRRVRRHLDRMYWVSNLGRVRSRTKVLKPTRNCKSGYYYVALSNGKGNAKNCLVSVLVAEAFIPNPEGKPEVNHKDLDKANNRSSNLEWATRIENAYHASAKGVFGKSLSIESVKEIKEELKAGTPVNVLAWVHGVSLTMIYNIRKGKWWKGA